jgi:hypothetical protein
MKISSLKRVYFSNECKTYDGASTQIVKYLEFIKSFLSRKINTVDDFINFVKEPTLIRYFLDELKIAYSKLTNVDNEQQDEENIYYDENKERDPFWDHITFVSKVYRYNKRNKGAVFIRYGCRDNNKKFTKENIDEIRRMIRLLEDVEELLFFNL